MPNTEEIAVAVVANEEVRVTRVLLLAKFTGTVAGLFIGGNTSRVMSLIS